MKKNVLMMTSEESFHNNYGAALQGYALYRTISSLNCDVSIVKYGGGQFPTNGRSYFYYFIKRKLSFLYHKIVTSEAEKKSKRLHNKYNSALSLRESLFNSFKNEYMRFYNEKRMGWFELKKAAPKADIYVCGSDQIWNPHFKGGHNDPGYFLAFAPKGSTKIAYAPSFGCSDLPKSAQESLATLLKDYSAITVREISGIDIIRRYANRDAKLVVDPTLLLTPDQWKEISSLPKGTPDKYILCYRFAESETTKKAIDELSKKLNITVISLPLSDVALRDPYQFIFDAGPKEFIGLIQNATLVCTDSFHATVFSILMKTPVCVFLREGLSDNSSMNCRVYSLLQMLHLEDLIQAEDKSTVEEALSCLKTDYTEAHEILAKERQASYVILENALQ